MKRRLRVIKAGNWWVLQGDRIVAGPIRDHGAAMDYAVRLVWITRRIIGIRDHVRHIEQTG